MVSKAVYANNLYKPWSFHSRKLCDSAAHEQHPHGLWMLHSGELYHQPGNQINNSAQACAYVTWLVYNGSLIAFFFSHASKFWVNYSMKRLQLSFCRASSKEENGISWKLLLQMPIFKKQKTCTMFLSSYRNKWKFGRTRNAVGTRATGECFYSFFEFSQTFTSVSITWYLF